MKTPFYFLLLFLFPFDTGAQQLLFSNRSDLKLPSQECYNVLQDSRGYLWFSTEAGVCRYDGDEIRVYGARKGVPGNSCYSICEYPAGYLWFLTSDCRVLRYDEKQDSLVEAGFCKNLEKCVRQKKLSQPYLIQPGDDNTLWISTNAQSFRADFKTGQVVPVEVPETKYYFVETAVSFLPAKKQIPWNGKRNAAMPVYSGLPIDLYIIREKDTICKQFSWENTSCPQWRILTAKNKAGDCFIGWDNKLIRLKKDNSLEIYTVSTVIISLYCDRDNGLWVGTLKGGVLYFKNPELKDPLVSLPGLSVSGICVDAENGTWCTTLEKGIYYCRSKYIIDYSNVKGLDQRPDLFKVLNGKLFFSSAYETVFEVKDQSVKTIRMKPNNGYGLSDIWYFQNRYLVTSGGFIASTDTGFSHFVFMTGKDGNSQFGAREIEGTENGRVFMLQHAELLELVNSGVVSVPVSMPSGCTTFLPLEKNRLLLGCKDGLYTVDLLTNTTQKIAGLDGAVADLLKDSSGKVWVACRDKGLYLLEGDRLRNVSDSLQLHDARFYALAIDRHQAIWLGSNKGLVKIDRSRKRTAVYTVFNGLPGSEVYAVACSDGRVYCASSEGLASFGLEDDLSGVYQPPLYIGSILVNGKAVQPGKDLLLSYDENFLTIHCEVPSFKNSDEPVLMYRLVGNYKQEAFFSKDRNVKLENLSPGKYELYLYAVRNNRAVGLPRRIRFEIEPPFWQRAWFIAVVLFLFFTLLYFLIAVYIHRIKRREAEKTKLNNLIAESQLAALQAQMNPHFIFNAINSIQRYILEKSKHEAYDYLARFSRLIRMVLDNSEEKVLPLQKEIETIRLYVELEQLRFKNSFAFHIRMGTHPDLFRAHLPAMLIQPYIENAIWHGLMHLEKAEKGELLLDIQLAGKILTIRIEDNGIGRKKAQEYAQQGIHKPVAMKLNQQRLVMINKMQHYEGARVEVTDLYNEKGMACGTRVEISLPIHYEN